MLLTIEYQDGRSVTHEISDFGVTKRNIWYTIVNSHTVQMKLDKCTYRISPK